ncbi:matrix metalloproteinase-20 [Clupea harengus]|uniref:Matrix metalloproteinase-20 n=1 Tax=Clupea harengus TaxID=7950 RepID=A0A6P3VZU2_CLUHA|nr:matrix metalloproteinase-20 [Clupea harengus]
MVSFALSVSTVWTRPLVQEAEDVRYAEVYLRKFYRMPMSGGPRSPRDLSSLEMKLREMQNFFGLKETGQLTPETLLVMREPRCGVPDVENFSLYPGRPKWKNHTATYKIAKYTTDLRREEVERSIHVALNMWSGAADLDFIKVDHGEADIVISFETKVHGDFFPFDGPKGVLAHAFEPGDNMGGDVHFDDDEIWRTGHRKPGFNLLTVAVHELGHSLGLSHSKDPSALMYPKYKRFSLTSPRLPTDDTLAIQALYGKRITKPETPTIPKKCQPNFSIGAVTMLGNEILFFKGSSVWLRTPWMTSWSRVKEGLISTLLPSVRSVDAAYNIPHTGVTFVFTGPKYWMVQKLKMKSYGGSIYDYGFPTTVKKIDAAVHLREYKKTYFFTGHVYYRYDEALSVMDSGFPRKIQSDWPGIGDKVDAAFQFREGSIQFFSGSKAYNFDYRERRVLYTIKANAWLGC